jgi:hypothetical protein
MRLKTVIMAAVVGASATSATAMAEDCPRQPGFDPASLAPPSLPLIAPLHVDALVPQMPVGVPKRDLRAEGFGKALLDEQLTQAQRERVAMEQQMQQMMAEVQRMGEAFRGYRPAAQPEHTEIDPRDIYRDEMSASQRQQAVEVLASLPRPAAPELPGLRRQFEAERAALQQQMDEYREANRAAYLSHRDQSASPTAGDPATAWRARMLERQQAAAEQQQASWRRQLEAFERCGPAPATAAAPSTEEQG